MTMHSSLKSENVELRSQIKVLTSNYEKLESRLGRHENHIKKLKDKKWLKRKVVSHVGIQVPQCSGPEMGLGATDGRQFVRPSGKPGKEEDRYELRSSKRRRDSTSAEKRKGNRLIEVKQGDTKNYSLRGVTSGFVNRKLEVVINSTTCGILARSWPEWLTIDSILNISITWIYLQDLCFVLRLACLLPNVTFLSIPQICWFPLWTIFFVRISCHPRLKRCGLILG
jgi:hypothetical protein